MSLLGKIFARGEAILKAAVGGGGPISGGYGGGSFQDQWNTRRVPTTWELLQQYKGDVFTCASINASVLASQTLRAYVTTGQGEQPTKTWATKALLPKQVDKVRKACRDHPTIRKAVQVDELQDHPILDLIEAPNKFMDGFRLFELTGLYLEMTGTAYWYKERDALGVPCNLWLVPPTEIYPIKDQYGYTVSYEAVRSKKSIPIEDVVFFSFPDLYSPYSKGKGPAQAAFGQITLQDKTESFNHSTMENRGRPDVFISPKEALGEPEAMRLEAKWNRRFRRAGAGGAMVLEQAVDVKPAGFSNKDLEMFQLQEASKLNTANSFMVPISFLKTEDVNRANADAGHYQHSKLAIRPRCMRVAGALNLQLVPDFDARIVLAYDDPVPVDVDAELKVRESNLNTGFSSINEEREEENLPPVEWGDKPWIPVAKAQPMSEDEKAAEQEHQLAVAAASAQPVADGPDEEDAEETKALIDYCCSDVAASPTNKRFKKLIIKAPVYPRERGGTMAFGWAEYKGTTHARRMPSAGRLKSVLKDFFRKQQLAVLQSILGKSLRKAEQQRKIPQQIDLTGWDKQMADATQPIVAMYFEEGGKGLTARLGLSDTFDVVNPKVREAIKSATFKFCEETNKSTSLELDDALDRLRKDLADGLVSQENTIAELTKRVSGVFDKASTYRAETIAMSESSRAVHAGQTIAAKESGLEIRFHWLLSQDACPICQELADKNEKGVAPGQNFGKVGDGPYSDVPYPPAHPRCQCTIVEEVVGEKPSDGDPEDGN